MLGPLWQNMRMKTVALLPVRLAIDLLLPPQCPLCRARVAQAGDLCPSCWNAIDFVAEPCCACCGLPFGFEVGPGALCGACMASPPPFDRARAAFHYDDEARRLVTRLKYGDRLDLVPTLARMAARAGEALLREADVLVPVPLHPFRLWQRRFNQSAEMARLLAQWTSKPFEPGLLRRVRRTRPQAGLSALQRQDNVRGAFQVPLRSRASLAGRHVLLVDDVFTTGATLTAATRALRTGGARSVDVLTLARVFRAADAPL